MTIRLMITMPASAIVIGLCLAACVCSCRTPERSVPPLTSWHTTTNELRSVTCFAFGGVGIAGVTSEGELAFRAVLASTNPLPYFKAMLTNGTTEAKLYALCGIRLLAPQDFDRHAFTITSLQAIARRMSGCLGYEEPAAEVVVHIKRGSYDHYFAPLSETHPRQ